MCPKFNPDAQPNIHELTIEEPEKESELPFDPEKEITEDDWQEIVKAYKDARGFPFLCFERALDVLDKKRFMEFGELDDETAGIYKSEIVEVKDNNKWEELNYDEINAKILLFAETLKNQNLDNDTWQTMIKQLGDYRKSGAWQDFARKAALMKILRPGKIGDIELSSEDWQKMKERLASLRISKTKFKSDINWRSFVIQAMLMKILSAQEINITDKGRLEVVIHKEQESASDSTPLLPEQKQF